MELSYSKILAVIINFVLLLAIIITIYKGVQAFIKFISKNKEMDRKLDTILSKLEKEEKN